MKFNGQKVDQISVGIDMNITGEIGEQSHEDAIKALERDFRLAVSFASFSGDIPIPGLIEIDSIPEIYSAEVLENTEEGSVVYMTVNTVWRVSPKLALKHVKHPDYWKPHVESLMARIVRLIPSAIQVEYHMAEIEILKSKGENRWEYIAYPKGHPDQWKGSNRAVYMLYDGFLEYWSGRETVKRQKEVIIPNRDLNGYSAPQIDCFVRAYGMNLNMSKKQKVQAIYAEWGLVDEAPENAYDIEQSVYLEEYTVPELQKIAKGLGVPYSGIRKAVLIERIRTANPNIEWEL